MCVLSLDAGEATELAHIYACVLRMGGGLVMYPHLVV